MVVRGVEAIVWRDDVSCIEHASKHLSQVYTVLTGLLGQFFGAKRVVCRLQEYGDVRNKVFRVG